MSVVSVGASSRPRRSNGKLWAFVVFFLVTAFVTYGKNREIFNPASEIARHFAPATLFLIPHALFAGTALIMGAFQFSNRLRARYVRVHRTMGYIYVICVLIGAPVAIPLAARTATPSLVAASVMQTFGWISCTLIALYSIRNGNVQQHRRWMIRGYPFAMIFTVARMIIPIPVVFRTGLLGIEIVVWTTIALAAIVPNIFLEWPAKKAKPMVKAMAQAS